MPTWRLDKHTLDPSVEQDRAPDQRIDRRDGALFRCAIIAMRRRCGIESEGFRRWIDQCEVMCKLRSLDIDGVPWPGLMVNGVTMYRWGHAAIDEIHVFARYRRVGETRKSLGCLVSQ